jgi:hypothetical protein
MSKYRCYLLDKSGIFASKQIESHDEEAAVAEAQALLAENDAAAGAELWIEAFLVRRLRKLDS